MDGNELMKDKRISKNINRNTDKKANGINKQSYSIILFGLALVMFFIVCIPGESLWLKMHNIVLGMFGMCSILWPILLLYVSLMLAFGKFETNKNKIQIYLACFVIVLFCLEIYIFSKQNVLPPKEYFKQIGYLYNKGVMNIGSGAVGGLIGEPLSWIIGITGLKVINSVFLFISLMLLTGMELQSVLKGLVKPFLFFTDKIKKYKNNQSTKNFNSVNEGINNRKDKSKIDIPIDKNCNLRENEIFAHGYEKDYLQNDKYNEELEIERVTDEYIENAKMESKKSDSLYLNYGKELTDEKKTYKYPPVALLNESEKTDEGANKREISTNSKMLVDTLRSFNVETKFIGVSRGPAVTRYELQPASGVKISKITSLADDVALNLAASGVRIEAPIPGKSAVGVEIPNKKVNLINMKELISSQIFCRSKSKLTVVLGKDISGKIIVTDLGKMPHLLIAGSTGSGKSVCINSFIISLLYKASPEEVKMLMIDPKVVELGVYNDIPHLLAPVVTDPGKAKRALSLAVDEMMRRYKIFAQNNVRDMYSYNMYIDENPNIKDNEGNVLTKMYSIVIIIDELSDLMMAAPNEIEDYICRLAQMARAAGMHLVIATQRPSVDVITGIIKANIPSRIALAVSSQIDSRTILDMSGAEKLLGRGDMLFLPSGSNKPLRVQGCYVTDREIENIVNYIKERQQSDYNDKITDEINKNVDLDDKNNSGSQCYNDKDPMFNEAVKCVVDAGQASTSLLQRRLRVGYARAGRLIDEMEKMGMVGPYEGSKPRQILINCQQLLEMNIRENDNL